MVNYRKFVKLQHVNQSISLLGGVSVSGSIALLFITKSGPPLMPSKFGMTNFSSMGSGVFTICHSGIFNPETTGGLANFDLKIENS